MRISVLTAVFNRVGSIAQAVKSVQSQTYNDVEHVVIDGASTDGTLEILHTCLAPNSVLVSESDLGIYDALNKGFARASGEIIGMMHSDDFFADSQVLADVAMAFADPTVDAVYGDIEYVAKNDIHRVIRYWRAGEFDLKKLSWGWMPPHPSLFLRRRVIEQWGGFDTRFRIAADYDAILRYFGKGRIKALYIPRLLVKMRMGGESNGSLYRIMLKSVEDYQALRRNGVGGIGALTVKNMSKIKQFF